MRVSHRLLAPLALAAAAGSGLAQTVYHVAPCGNDAWTGTSPTCQAPDGPKATVQAAVSAAADLDEVLVLPGTYVGDVDFLGKSIWLHSTGGEEATLLKGRVSCASGEGPLAIFEGFTVSNYPALRQGMRVVNSSPTVRHCTFLKNEVVDHFYGGGGLMVIGPAAPTVSHCKFTGNVARGTYDSPACGSRGGGLFLRGTALTVTNCVFSRNLAVGGCRSGPQPYGGAIFVEPHTNASVRAVGCTFAGNFSEGPGYYSNAIFSTGASAMVINCAMGMHQNMLNATVLYPCFELEFVRNPGPGPDLLWGTEDDDYGDLHLRPGSPCIDAADNTAVPAAVTTDHDGNPRFLDDCGVADSGVPGGAGGDAIVDMGAYEFQGTTGVQSYCVTSPNSAGEGAVMACYGSVSVAANDFVLVAGPVGAGQSGMFFHGDARAQKPFGDGFLCVGGNVARILPAVAADGTGMLSMALDGSAREGLGIEAGMTLCFQAWYRDHGGASGYNLSDGLAVTFLP